MINKDKVIAHLVKHHGVLTTKSAVVHRQSYFGNNVIASNDSVEFADERGFVPVELWIMSMVEADNPIKKPGEGLTKIKIGSEEVSLLEMKNVAEDELFGPWAKDWPLTKVLDIGGQPVKTSFGTEEVPPIPVHIHPQKLEAYFFPTGTNQAFTRIGLKEGATKEEVKEGLQEFGTSDKMYTLLNEFPIESLTGWTVPTGVLHAPGPALTFEIQRPLEDYYLFSWRLGERLGADLEDKYRSEVLRDQEDEGKLLEQVVLKQANFHKPRAIEEGEWGKRYQIFFDQFYGEGWEVLPGQKLVVGSKEVPQAGIVWVGQGEVNGNPVSQKEPNEFLVVPDTELTIKNTGSETLFIYTVEPIRD